MLLCKYSLDFVQTNSITLLHLPMEITDAHLMQTDVFHDIQMPELRRGIDENVARSVLFV